MGLTGSIRAQGRMSTRSSYCNTKALSTYFMFIDFIVKEVFNEGIVKR